MKRTISIVHVNVGEYETPPQGVLSSISEPSKEVTNVQALVPSEREDRMTNKKSCLHCIRQGCGRGTLMARRDDHALACGIAAFHERGHTTSLCLVWLHVSSYVCLLVHGGILY
jgi:uncharacterized UBP type Zn finger protein